MQSDEVGQLLLIGVPGTELDSETAAMLRRIQPGGYILFGRNIKTSEQLRRLIDDLRDLSRVEPVITIDQEGGRVSRLKLLGNEPPNAQQLRDTGDRGLIRRHGDITGKLLRLFGFNLDLCPVLDISFDDEADNSLRGRCYGKTAMQVMDFAGVFNAAMRETGVLSCGKHFPGYAAATFDPHHELPVLERSRAEMEEHELAVFRHFADKVDSMMIAHAVYRSLDNSDLPASLNPAIINKLLRDEMGFSGLVMTDDLDMGAILNHYGFEDTMRMGIEAGNDFLMICHRVALAEKVVPVLEGMTAAKLAPALERMAAFKRQLVKPDAFSPEAHRALDEEVWNLRVATLGEEAARQRSPEDGKRSPVELY